MYSRVVEIVALVISFSVSTILMYRLAVTWRNFAKAQRLLLIGNLMWAYAMTQGAVARFQAYTTFPVRAYVAYLGSLLIIWALSLKVDPRISKQETWKVEIPKEDLVTYKAVLQILAKSKAVQEEA